MKKTMNGSFCTLNRRAAKQANILLVNAANWASCSVDEIEFVVTDFNLLHQEMSQHLYGGVYNAALARFVRNIIENAVIQSLNDGLDDAHYEYLIEWDTSSNGVVEHVREFKEYTLVKK